MSILWSLVKRGVPEPPADAIQVQFRSGAWIAFLLDALILIPLFIFVQYTVSCIYPVLAIVENEKPPAYGPIAIDDNSPRKNTPSPPRLNNDEDDEEEDAIEPPAGRPRPITSSLRATHKLLNAHGGFGANFRGLSCALAIAFLSSIITLFTPSLPFAIVGSLVASLVLSPLSTAWVHIVISTPSTLRFWNRIPSFNRTIAATWKAVLLEWASIQSTRLIIYLAALLMGLNTKESSLSWLPGMFVSGPPSGKDTANMVKCLVLLLGAVMLIFAILPAHVVLVRVQASLLPPDQDTIIPFDRSFEGRVEPAVVKGKGWASVSDAWATFSRAAWTRLILLQIKIFFAAFLTTVLAMVFVLPQVFFLMEPVKQ